MTDRSALDELEARLGEWIFADRSARVDDARQVFELLEINKQSRVAKEQSGPDAGDAGHSIAELNYLARALGVPRASVSPPSHSAPGATAERPRAGYQLHGDPYQDDARVVPALARALANADSDSDVPGQAKFDDLWGIDMRVWRALEIREKSRIAELWLRSPGRRLVRTLDAIHKFGRHDRVGATDTTRDSICRAAGIFEMPLDQSGLQEWLNSQPSRWRDLHASVPGPLMRCWQPRDGNVSTALRRLDRASPASLRGAAIGWLLGRAASDPYYDIDGVGRDLRDDLPARFAAALTAEPADGSFSAALETVLLHHAAHIVDPDGEDCDDSRAVTCAWSLSRWLYRCTMRSPFYGGDEERLHVRLRAMLPKQPASVPSAHPLHPRRIGPDGIDIDELALVSGVVGHFYGPGPHMELVPLPLVNQLRRIASRAVRELEAQAEAVSKNPFGLDNMPHVAPPWVARRFLTDRRIAWLAGLAHDRAEVFARVFSECLAEVAANPHKFFWLGFALNAEGHELPGPARQDAAKTWRKLARPSQPAMQPHALAAMAAGILPELTVKQRTRALDIAASAESGWRPGLFEAHADAAAREKLDDHWSNAMQRLLDAARDPDRDKRERLNSAHMALRRSAAAQTAEAKQILRQLAELTTESPFREHRALQREIRRYAAS